ncbi:bZIP transcription factor [Aspergillus saccharolyticus JOP 1030-1]|uniref:BZIP domain-containing protein n=1 Tax=Aspergillus saccharolyticus JOP 1030-1 TaxID=1450539 RepID=A0A318Z9W2_9EURO|nr:hypothetical protein BP01DRAFT_375601 [Aspergillus saccharolyticus JOP 1030-1]PYH43217.1 hypothetical protein BP01DRAFT_375601 [Aspergillus saccharolyticus JOP 1030-1]
MDGSKPSKDADRLARIRDNQRKSRAKKQAHIRELEEKLLSLQELVRHKDVEHRLAVQGLEAENRSLRALLSDLGLSSSTVEEYLKATADGSSSTRKIAIPGLPRSAVTTRSCRGRSQTGGPCETRPTTARTSPALDPESGGSWKDETAVSGQAVTNIPTPLNSPSVCGCSPHETPTWPESASGDVLTTTLCAIADELITQYNTRGVELDEIRRKLWAGFTKGLTTEEGCRVQNQILFQVLDEISNH